jgi:hypothetical protein
MGVPSSNFLKVPPKVPPNFLDVVGVWWRSIELVYTKALFIGLLGFFFISPEFTGVVFGGSGGN